MLPIRLLTVCFLLSASLRADNSTNSNWTFNVSEGGMANPSRWADNDPEIAVFGTTVHVIWFTQELPSNTYAIYYRRSRDNGKTWDPRVRLYSQPQNLLLDGNGTFRKLAVDNAGIVHLGIAIHANAPGALIYLRSADGGSTWDQPKTIISGTASLPNPADVRVSTDGVRTTFGMGLQCGTCMANSYTLATSSDGGKTFTNSVVVNDSTEYHNIIDMKRAADRTYLMYSGTDTSLSFGKMYLAVAPDSGAATSNVVSTPWKNGVHLSQISTLAGNYEPRIAISGDKAYITWYGKDDSNVERLFFRRFSGNGAQMGPAIASPDLISPVGFSSPLQASLAASGPSAFQVYLVNTQHVILRRFDEATGAFAAPIDLTSNATWVNNGKFPLVMSAGQNTTFVMWKNGFFSYSTDGFQTHVSPLIDSPAFTWMSNDQWSMATGADGSVYWVMAGKFNTYGNGLSDNDIFFGKWSPPAQPGATNKALVLTTAATPAPGRYDGMEIPPSPASSFTDAMTAAIWVQPQTGGLGCNCFEGKYQALLSKTELPGFPNSYFLGTIGAEGSRQWVAQIRTLLQTYELRAPAGQPMVPGKWTHLAFTYDDSVSANNFQFYVDGALVAQTSAVYPLNTGEGALFLGTQGNWTVDDLSLWNRALSPSEIVTVQNSTLTGAESGLAAYYNFDDTTLALNNPAASGVLMYQESYVPSTRPNLSPQPAISGIANIATYQLNFIAPESLASIYGTNLGSGTVTVKDSASTGRVAQTFYQSAGRVDFQVPAGTASGQSSVKFSSTAGSIAAVTTVLPVAPSIFTADQSGKGLAAGSATTVSASGAQASQPLNNPVDLSDASAQVYLILYGTGIRGYRQGVVCSVGGTPVPCVAVPQGTFVGLDQVNIGPLPQSLRGSGSVGLAITADGVAANAVTATIAN